MTDEAIEEMAAWIWFVHVDQHGYPNGLPTWDELPEHSKAIGFHSKGHVRSIARAALTIAEEAVLEELMEPTPEMLAAALPIVDLESLSREAKEAGAAAVMYLSGRQRIIPQLEGEAVVQAAQLYTDWQAMLSASPLYRRVKGE